jgi:tripartite-type tricarboxylate transporter receptor subunit TctC
MTARICSTALALLTATSLMLPCGVLAQAFPSKPMRLVVPYGPGGLPDVMARLVAQKMAESMGQPVNVENKPGASGIIAAEFVAKSDPDGHTLFVGDIAQYALNPALRSNLPYDTLRDFVPITQALRAPLFLMVNAGMGVKNVAELVALAKAKPGINYGSSGNASVHQLGMEQFALMAGFKVQHIPYKGVAQAVPAMLAGDTQLMFVSPTSAGIGEQVRAGKVVILAVGSAQRWAQLPAVPTMAEAGYPLEAVSIIGFFTRTGTPAPVVAKLHAELFKALKSPDVESKMPGLGAVVVAGTPEEFTARIRADQANFAKLVKEVRVTVD